MSFVSSAFGRRSNNLFNPFSLDVWDPFRDWPLNSSSDDETSPFAATYIDWKKMPEAHVFKADVPGSRKTSEVEVEVEVVEDGNILQISGKRNREEKEEKNDTWHRIERIFDKSPRHFRVSKNTKMDQIKASMENGVLTVIVPRRKVKKLAVKAIEISG